MWQGAGAGTVVGTIVVLVVTGVGVAGPTAAAPVAVWRSLVERPGRGVAAPDSADGPART